MSKYVLIIIASFVLVSCTWVKLSPEGEGVKVMSSADVTQCKKLGITRAMLKDKIAGISRNKDKVKGELETLARNAAANMGGDTIVSASEIENGEQVFTVYNCLS